jgi:hypothetical protein
VRREALVAQMGEKGGAFRVLVEKSEGKKPLGRPMLVWEGDIKTDLQ